jgi:hypothetical protein
VDVAEHLSALRQHGQQVVGIVGRSDADTASDLYHLLWNRCSADGLEVFGDRSVLQLWQERARVTWS